ncbi:hypothetical protein BDN72DRAFT_830616 [Pluteus cervinus]|uniref:Uncharacterized protein n=1 Tax=Pluteus cervinus TaxID=181527 RepID=A0ACD3BHD4_9AGAR|nr:hypothetical protein BDN72DRAFT_830616 [Pluteus cervinus]
MSDVSENIEPHPIARNSSRAHEPHPDCPDTLDCLPDTDGRPQHTLPVILRCAILGSPKKRLTIREIYATMEAKYSYYKTAGPTWKQSVRHHLSLNRLFERQPRPVTEPGFGSYWTVNLAAPPGTKRPRKRGRPNKGLPDGAAGPARKRGRPRKAIASSSTSDPLPPEYEEDDEEKAPQAEEEPEAVGGTEEECESEEEMDIIHPLERRTSLPGLSAYGRPRPPEPCTLPPFSSIGKSTESIIDQMQIELSELRRQSNEAFSTSTRLQEQLAQAQAEAARTRASLKTAESMLEDECRRRKEAERLVEEEAKRRRAAEDALHSMAH